MSNYIPALYLYLLVFLPYAQNNHYNITAFACGGGCFFYYVTENTYYKVADITMSHKGYFIVKWLSDKS